MPNSSNPAIFITGGTGYIGGSFLELMLIRGYVERFSIAALVRRPEDVAALRERGIRPVPGTLDDYALLRAEAGSADIVLNTANCDHESSAKALAEGLADRYDQTGKRPIFVHTSGAGVLSANSRGTGVAPGDDPGATLWDDTDFAAHAAIPDHAPHRMVDLEIFAAARSGKVKTYLVVPPTVFGQGLGYFAAKRMSIQLPRLVYQSLIARRALYVGSGNAQWTNVHVADLAELYLLIVDGALKDEAPEGLKGLYYPASEFFTWRDAAARVGEVLFKRNILASPVPQSGLQPGWFWGSNVRMRTPNSGKLGWKPQHGGTSEMLQDIEWDAELIIRMIQSQR